MSSLAYRINSLFPEKTRNFWLHISEGVFASFAGELTMIFPLVAASLGASELFFGTLTSIGSLSFIVTLLSAPSIEGFRKKKRLVLLFGIVQRMPLVLIPLFLYLYAQSAPKLCLIAIAVINLVTGTVLRLLVPAWLDLIAETIPQKRVPRLFGWRNGTSAALGLLAGPFAALILDRFEKPNGFIVIYLIGFVSMAVSWYLFSLVDEVPDAVQSSRKKKIASYFRDLLKAVKLDRNFRVFLLYRGIVIFGFCAQPFYAFVAYKYFGVSAAFVAGTFMMSRSSARIAGNFLFPFLAERIGNKAMLMLGTWFHTASALCIVYAENGYWFIPAMFLSGLGLACRNVSGSAFMMSICPSGRRIGYMTLAQVALAPVGIVIGPIAGFTMQRFGYEPLFAFAAAFLLSALLPLSRCYSDNNKTVQGETS